MGPPTNPVRFSLINSLFGDGSSRKPSLLTIKMEEVARGEKDSMIRFSSRIENSAFGLVLGVEATVPADITSAVRNSLSRGPDGLPEPVRFINGDVYPPTANAAALQVINHDLVTVPSEGHVRLRIPGHELHLPGGTLPILSVGSTVTLLRNRENFQRTCDAAHVLCP